MTSSSFHRSLAGYLILAFAASGLAAPIGKQQYEGKATWYNVGLGACGASDVDSDFIVALSTDAFGNGSHCNKQIRITHKVTRATHNGKVRDKCPGCAPGALDISPALFKQFAPLDKGIFQAEWTFV